MQICVSSFRTRHHFRTWFPDQYSLLSLSMCKETFDDQYLIFDVTIFTYVKLPQLTINHSRTNFVLSVADEIIMIPARAFVNWVLRKFRNHGHLKPYAWRIIERKCKSFYLVYKRKSFVNFGFFQRAFEKPLTVILILFQHTIGIFRNCL